GSQHLVLCTDSQNTDLQNCDQQNRRRRAKALHPHANNHTKITPSQAPALQPTQHTKFPLYSTRCVRHAGRLYGSASSFARFYMMMMPARSFARFTSSCPRHPSPCFLRRHARVILRPFYVISPRHPSPCFFTSSF